MNEIVRKLVFDRLARLEKDIEYEAEQIMLIKNNLEKYIAKHLALVDEREELNNWLKDE